VVCNFLFQISSRLLAMNKWGFVIRLRKEALAVMG